MLSLNVKNDLPQFFVCPVGLVGAGKSTVLKPLVEKLPLIRISSDDVRHILKDRNVDYGQLMKIIGPLAEELSLQGYSIAFDADCGNPKTKKLIIDLAEKVNAKVFWIHINPPEDFIINKLRNYNHTWLFKNGEQAIENYFLQKERRKEENTQFVFLTTIDTSRPDLQLQIEETLRLIKNSLI